MNKNYPLSRVTVMKYLKALYVKDDIDIFNYQITKGNPLTYHHIIKVEELKALEFPTTKTIENGIVISRFAHSYLHLIEDFAPDIFFHLNKIILLITKERRLPTLNERNLIEIMLEAFEYRMKEYYEIKPRYLKRVLTA